MIRAAAVLVVAAWLALETSAEAAEGVPVLMYHQITDAKPAGDTVISPAKFAQQMEYLASQGYQTLSMDELTAIMRGQSPVPRKAVVLTFDDGWRNVLAAVPILDKHRFKASFWIVTDFATDPSYLDWGQIKALAQNPRYEIQGHTKTHPWSPFSNLLTWAEGKTPGKSMEDVRAELVDSKRTLEAQLGRRVDYLAWPRGLFNDAMISVAKENGYKGLLTTDDGWFNTSGSDEFRIARTTINGRCELHHFVGLVADFRNRYNC